MGIKNGLNKGFTVVELLIVIVVISILAAITIATYGGIQERADETVAKADAVNSRKVIMNYQAKHGVIPTQTQVAEGYAYGNPSTCSPAGSTDASGKLCLVASNGGMVMYTPNTATQTFTVGIGKGSHLYRMNDRGDFTKLDCSQDNSQGAATGYSKVYTCPGGSLYSQ